MEYIDFVRKNDCKDSFHNLSHKTQSMLITENNGFEVIKMFIPKGSKGVMPPLDKNVTEVYYILEGSLSLIYKNKEEVLNIGDTFVLRHYSKAIPYHVLSDLIMIFSTNHLEFNKHKQLIDQLNTYLDTLQKTSLKTRDHCQRVEELVTELCENIDIDHEAFENLRYAARFHDVGKVKSKGKEHPVHSYDLVMAYLGEDVADIILQHHEKIDGTGYPYGLKNDEIRLEAKILAVINTYDYLLYQKHLSKNEALKEIQERVGKDFDKEIVNIFITTIGLE